MAITLGGVNTYNLKKRNHQYGKNYRRVYQSIGERE